MGFASISSTRRGKSSTIGRFHRVSLTEEHDTQSKGIIPIPFLKSSVFVSCHIQHGSNLLLMSTFLCPCLLVCGPRKASFIQPLVRTVSPGLQASTQLWNCSGH